MYRNRWTAELKAMLCVKIAEMQYECNFNLRQIFSAKIYERRFILATPKHLLNGGKKGRIDNR